MAKDREDKLDPAQPTLVVQHGNTARRFRRLEKDVFVLGRAPGCDLGLDAPDVAAVHCVIHRGAEGWRVRDCSGRGGTRLNGRSVLDEALADEDVLQIGSFSFALHLPKQKARPATAPARLQRSRENLVRLALRLRGRVREAAAAAAGRVEEQLAARQEDLDRRADELEELRRDLDVRLGELRQTRQETAAETLALLQRNEQSKLELAEWQSRAEAAARAALEVQQARHKADEEAHALALAEQRRSHPEPVGDAHRILEIRGRELSHYAGHLCRERLRLRGQEESLAARRDEWSRERQEAAEYHTRQGEQIARGESVLREQRSEVVRLMGEMRQLRHSLRQPPAEDVDALRRQNEELRQRLEAADALAHRLDRCHFELEDGRSDLEEQIRVVQERYSELDRVAREAEALLALGRERFVQERDGLQRLRDGLGRSPAPSPTQDTVVDMPSPLHPIAEAPRAPTQLAAAQQ